VAKRSKKSSEADIFRAHVERLRNLPETDWGDWEADWLDAEARRHPEYLYSEKERIILNQLIAATTPFEGYNGWSVPDLLRAAHNFLADLDEPTARFVEILWSLKPRALRVRQIVRLARIVGVFEPVGRDEYVESVLRETKGSDIEVQKELPEWVPFSKSSAT
jgi:hypothetical protein